ncbi:molybdopterin oxidoreductase family protein [Geobacillus sp. C56-T2]|uniref:assimilatory nitrate reductase catalytic subunit NasC n=1 Tax=Geobacillus sp. C56-T2 TaxID=600773 RepID=UPI0011A6F0B3|nr:nitrate reductase [Geobacillus sp. C56-T2]NNV05858.1 nitrite reductase [Geobacillus sp. MMMUD3]TWG30669.1 assimilatory nitrate reductase (NADH) alpha subunit apoprotein [Geobacillus sp. C56-T2]
MTMTNELLRYFRAKEKERASETAAATQCPFCSVQCPLQLVEERIVERRRYKAVPIDNPTSNGRLCLKGINAHQHALHPERLLFPLAKVDGRFVRVSWEEALSLIAERIISIQKKDGVDAFAVYGGGSLTNEEAYLLGKFARVALKTRHIDYNGRFCMSAAAAAMNDAFGLDRGLTNPLSDIPLAQTIILVGTNIAECQPTLMPYVYEAKKNGAFLIVVDPRETKTAALADLHLPLKPGTDAALAIGVGKVLIEERYIDEAFVRERTVGFAEWKQHVEAIDMDEIVRMTDVPAEKIRLAARKYGEAPEAIVLTARGLEQQADGYAAVRQWINAVLATGKIGRPGSGFGSITGQGNGQGGREHGQKADQLPGYRSIEHPEHRRYIASVWGVAPDELPRKGVSAYEMMQKIDAGEITGLFVMGSNPVVSSPNAAFVARALKKLEFLVVADLFLSETAELADLVLPVSSYLEDEGTVTNVEGRICLRPAARKCPGEVKHDWEILCAIAHKLGKGRHFSFASAEEIFNELRLASRGGKADYYGVTYERLRRERIYWPCPDVSHLGTPRLFTDRFAHPDGKARFAVLSFRTDKEETDESYPLYLTTGRVLVHYLSGTQTRRSPALAARQPEATVEIHPRTAKRYGIGPGMLVRIETRRGAAVVRSRYNEQIREDTIFVPFHWSGLQQINNVTSDELDPHCRMPAFKRCAARVRPVVDLGRN